METRVEKVTGRELVWQKVSRMVDELVKARYLEGKPSSREQALAEIMTTKEGKALYEEWRQASTAQVKPSEEVTGRETKKTLAYGTAERLAEELRKTVPSMTREGALSEVLKRYPILYELHQEELRTK